MKRQARLQIVILMIFTFVRQAAGSAHADTAVLHWKITGSMGAARAGHVASRLPGGKVLVAGGVDGSAFLASAELYDPVSGTWSSTGSMSQAREFASAVLLPSGKVLVAGGQDNSGGVQFLTSAELYDPASGRWSSTGSMVTARVNFALVLMKDGRVVAAGGAGTVSSSTEVYDPATGRWTATGDLQVAKLWPKATLLADGRVLIAGGMDPSPPYDSTDAELFDPSTDTWTETGPLIHGRLDHTLTLLKDGTVLASGGIGDLDGIGKPLALCERYDPASGTWTATGKMAKPRAAHTATRLLDGRVVVVEGEAQTQTRTAEVYDPVAGTWSLGGKLVDGRIWHTATLLPDGLVLVAGGHGSVDLASAELGRF